MNFHVDWPAQQLMNQHRFTIEGVSFRLVTTTPFEVHDEKMVLTRDAETKVYLSISGIDPDFVKIHPPDHMSGFGSLVNVGEDG